MHKRILKNSKVLSDTYQEPAVAGTVTELLIPLMYANYNPVGLVVKEIPHLNNKHQLFLHNIMLIKFLHTESP